MRQLIWLAAVLIAGCRTDAPAAASPDGPPTAPDVGSCWRREFSARLTVYGDQVVDLVLRSDCEEGSARLRLAARGMGETIREIGPGEWRALWDALETSHWRSLNPVCATRIASAGLELSEIRVEDRDRDERLEAACPDGQTLGGVDAFTRAVAEIAGEESSRALPDPGRLWATLEHATRTPPRWSACDRQRLQVKVADHRTQLEVVHVEVGCSGGQPSLYDRLGGTTRALSPGSWTRLWRTVEDSGWQQLKRGDCRGVESGTRDWSIAISDGWNDLALTCALAAAPPEALQPLFEALIRASDPGDGALSSPAPPGRAPLPVAHRP